MLSATRASRIAVAAAVALAVASTAGRARAQAEPSPRFGDEFDFMNLLARHGLHDLHDERWNAYGQATYISSWKLPFAADYTNLNGSSNSLLPGAERSFSASITAFVGVKLWRGAEVYAVPELIAIRPLSALRGLGGAIQNFELQKTGAETLRPYLSRMYFQQTFELGGRRELLDSDPMQLGATVDRRRLVVRVGDFSVIDFFDKNSFAGDLRRQFTNMAFLTYAAYDFAADARGYAFGAMATLVLDDWAFRLGRFTPPRDPNSLPLDYRFFTFYGDQLEIEHGHRIAGLAGAVRVLGFRNHENIARWDDAVAAHARNPAQNAAACTSYNYGSANAGAPDLCWARKTNVKLGIGVNVEQHATRDLGVFVRAMYADGETEVDSFSSSDRSLSFGATSRGGLWRRPLDLVGVGAAVSWISARHANYLAQGGVDGFVGDGALRAAPEGLFEVFYNASVISPLWLGGDYQHIIHPAYNQDRGPVDIFAVKAHAEF